MVSHRNKLTETETERQRDRERDRERQRETERDRERQRGKERERLVVYIYKVTGCFSLARLKCMGHTPELQVKPSHDLQVKGAEFKRILLKSW